MKYQHQRRRIFIDRPVQGALLLRALLYWAVSLLTQQLIVFLFVIVTAPAEDFAANRARLWWHVQLSVVGAAAILPIILLDFLKLSHRWVGPVFRLRASLHALSRGEPVPPIRFREGDFWQELASNLTAVSLELDQYRAALRKGAAVRGSPQPTNALESLRESEEETDLTSSAVTVPIGAEAPPSVLMASGWSALPRSVS